MDNTDDVHAEKIRSLSVWSGPIQLQPLKGGITNQNNQFEVSGDRFVARIGAELLILGVDRRDEAECHRAAHSLGVAPALIHGENGVLVSRYIQSRTLDPAGAREPGMELRLAQVLRQLHEGWDGLMGELLFFCPFQASRTYVATSRRLGARLPHDIDAMIETAPQAITNHRSLHPGGMCHNDLLPANILDDGERIWIVDWEYAGMGNPLFDLAGVTANCGYAKERESRCSKAIAANLANKTCMSYSTQGRQVLAMPFWGVVQTAVSDLDFDYHEYARLHFDKYRAALSALSE